MKKGNQSELAGAIVWSFISIVIDSPVGKKEKLPARLLTTLTVLFLIFAGSPFADISANTANAETNSYASLYTPTGTIYVNTDNTAATFNISGQATYSGNGTSWSQSEAPEGTYSITFDPISGQDTPASDTQTLIGGGNITFTGLYNKTVYTVTLQASADAYIGEFKQENNTNFGTNITMSVKSFLPGSSENYKNGRSLVMFDVSSIPPGSTIISSTLQLYAMNTSAAGRNYNINRVEQYWSETDIKWNNKPAVSPDATSFTDTPASPSWMNWSVAQDVQAWVSGAPNYGWQISDRYENSPVRYNSTYYTREYFDIDLTPRLVVRYTI